LKRFFCHSKHTQKVVVNGRFSVNVWGWISAQGPGVLTHIIGKNNAEVYLHILENIMLPSVNAVFPQNHFIYQPTIVLFIQLELSHIGWSRKEYEFRLGLRAVRT
jgi:hypothetical protein